MRHSKRTFCFLLCLFVVFSQLGGNVFAVDGLAGITGKAQEIVDPASPAEPGDQPPGQTDPGKPQNPDKPEKAGDPQNPAKPGESQDPNNPGEPPAPPNPGDPNQPPGQIDPSNPVNPDDPQDPNNPAKPGDPQDPNSPDKPGDPNKPVQPENPGDPQNPAKPGDPQDQNNPGESPAPPKPDDPNQPPGQTDPDKPVQPENPSDPQNPAKPGDPQDPNNPMNPQTPVPPAPDVQAPQLVPGLNDILENAIVMLDSSKPVKLSDMDPEAFDPATPYYAEDKADLAKLAELVNEKAVGFAGATVTVSGPAINAGGGEWKPIGTKDHPFRGTFNGQGASITNLAIGTEGSPGAQSYQGLFGYVQGTVENVRAEGNIYTSGDYVGGIVGYYLSDAPGKCLSNCSFNGTVSGGSNVGGTAGMIQGDFGLSSAMQNSAAVKATGDSCGGLVGKLWGSLYCPSTLSNEGAVSGNNCVGGIIGTLDGQWTSDSAGVFSGRLINEGAISGGENVGGLFGKTEKPLSCSDAVKAGAVMKNSGTVTGGSNAGGIVGAAASITSVSFTMENTADIKCSGSNAGGIVGSAVGAVSVSGGTLTNEGKVSGTTGQADAVGGIIGLAAGDVSLTPGGQIINRGAVSGALNAGGLVGAAKGAISIACAEEGQMTNEGAVSAAHAAGGILGLSDGTSVSVSGVELLNANISCDNAAGGIIGQASGTVTAANCYAEIGTLSSKSGVVGGIVGAVDDHGNSPAIQTSFCYYPAGIKEGTGEPNYKFAGTGSPAITNSYLLVGDAYGGGEDWAKKQKDFQAGAVCYALAQGNPFWGQKIGTDFYPMGRSSQHPDVVKVQVDKKTDSESQVDKKPDLESQVDKNSDLKSIEVKPDGKNLDLESQVDKKPDPNSIEVKPDDPAGANANQSFGSFTYANPGTVVYLKATGLKPGDELVFRPAETVEKRSGGTPGKYQLHAAEADMTLTYSLKTVVPPDPNWYQDVPVLAINNEAQLRAFAKKTAGGMDFKGKTITLNADVVVEGIGWTPVGSKEHPFSGTFQAEKNPGSGKYYEIRGLETETDNQYTGLFGSLSGATLKNIRISGKISGGDYTGGIAGYAEKSTFENCQNNAEIHGKNNTGGIAGYAVDCAFQECANSGEVTGSENTGGLAGCAADSMLQKCVNSGKISGTKNTGGILGCGLTSKTSIRLTDCRNEAAGSVQGTGAYTAGVAGYLKGTGTVTVKGCSNMGSVTGGTGNYTAGVVGQMGASPQRLEGLYNLGSVSGANYTGGVIGSLAKVAIPVEGLYNEGAVSGTGQYTGGVFGGLSKGSNDLIQFCYNGKMGTVKSSGQYVGGVAGYMQGSYAWSSGVSKTNLTNCYNLGSVSAETENTYAGGVVGFSGKSNVSMYAYAQNCFNYGTVTGKQADRTGAVTASGYEYDKNSYFLEGSVLLDDGGGDPKVIEKPEDSQYGDILSQPKETFATGELAYRLDHGGSQDRTTVWSQDGNHPVAADSSHHPVYQFSVKVLPADERMIIGGSIFFGPADAPKFLGYAARGTDVHLNVRPLPGCVLDKARAIGVSGKKYETRLSTDESTVSFALPGEDVVLNAIFMGTPVGIEPHTVLFDANSGSWKGGAVTQSAIVAFGKRVSPWDPSPTKKDGYDLPVLFTGWYLDQACSDIYNFNAVVKENLTLYAGWQPIPRYQVTFDANGGTLDGQPKQEVIVTGGALVAPPKADTVKNGDQVFRGWFTDKETAMAFDFDRPVQSSFTLYAGWKNAGDCVVIFDADGGTLTKDGVSAEKIRVNVPKGSPVGDPAGEGYQIERESLSSTAYKFDSWSDPSGDPWDFKSKVDSDLTLSAKWTPDDLLGSGTKEDPVRITGLNVLSELRDRVNKGKTYEKSYFKLDADISLPADWVSIGVATFTGIQKSFQGNFDGGGHTITLNRGQTNPVFAGIKQGGVVENLNLEGTVTADLPAALVLQLKGGTIRNITLHAKLHNVCGGLVYCTYPGTTIEDCVVKSGSLIKGYELVGGMVALGRSGGSGAYNVTNCEVEKGVSIIALGPSGIGSAATAKGVGGIMAYGMGNFTDCKNGADITVTNRSGGGSAAGGILGSGNSVSAGATFLRCVNTGNIIANGGGIGGIAGTPYQYTQAYPFNLTNCYSTGDITVTDGKEYVGGLVGQGWILDNCYYYGNWQVAEGVKHSGVLAGASHEIKDSFYGLKNEKEVTPGDLPEESGAALLPAAAFEDGEAAYRLDGGEEKEHKKIWTQDEALHHPSLGEPTYRRFEGKVTGDGEGTLNLKGIRSGLTIYDKENGKVTVTAVPKEEETVDGKIYTYSLKSLTVNDEPFQSGSSATLAEDSVAIAEFAVTITEVKPPEPVKPEPDKPAGGTGNGDGSGNGTGTGGGTGNGDGNGQGFGNQGTADGQGEGTGTAPGNENGKGTVPGGEIGGQTEKSQSSPASAVKKKENDQTLTETPAISQEKENDTKQDKTLEAANSGGLQGGGSGAVPKDTKKVTVFEIVKKTVEENPWTVICLVVIVVGILTLSGYRRYRNFKKR